MKVYLAGPLLTEAEQEWLRRLRDRIEKFGQALGRTAQAIWPYELTDQEEIERLGEMAKQKVFERCKSNLG